MLHVAQQDSRADQQEGSDLAKRRMSMIPKMNNGSQQAKSFKDLKIRENRKSKVVIQIFSTENFI